MAYAADKLDEAKSLLIDALRDGLLARHERKLETIIAKLEVLQAELAEASK